MSPNAQNLRRQLEPFLNFTVNWRLFKLGSLFHGFRKVKNHDLKPRIRVCV